MDESQDSALLKIITEQVKMPLLQIARQAELSVETATSGYQNISHIADITLKFIDNFLLSFESDSNQVLELEPVSLPLVMQNTADNLNNMAKIYDCTINLHNSKSLPVMSRRDKLEAALTMLGYSFIESLQPLATGHREILIDSYRSRSGITVGMFSAQVDLGSDHLKKSLRSATPTRQNFPDTSHTTGAGIFIADSLLNKMATELQATKRHNLQGIVTTLLPSMQLSLMS